MHTNLSIASWAARGFSLIGLAVCLTGSVARAQDAAQVGESSANTWQNFDWLKPAEDQQRQAASGETFSTTAGQTLQDPFTVLSTGSLWQENNDSIYTRRLDDPLVLSCEANTSTLDDGSDELSRGQKIGLQIQPAAELTLSGNVHDFAYDTSFPGYSTTSKGIGCSVESHLPLNSVVTLGLDSDRSSADLSSDSITQTKAYDAQIQQPLGKLPLTAVFKGHYEQTVTPGAPVASLPTLEQSLIWKPIQDTTLQMGLRQQKYEEYPGIENLLNEALFADWSQKIVDDVSWHSYAEVLNSRGLTDQAPASPIASGANGTPQATVPGSNASLTSSLPISLDDQTLTFSTGPSFRIQKDLSASLEYSNRWDQNPLPGTTGQEERVSISVKGTF